MQTMRIAFRPATGNPVESMEPFSSAQFKGRKSPPYLLPALRVIRPPTSAGLFETVTKLYARTQLIVGATTNLRIIQKLMTRWGFALRVNA